MADHTEVAPPLPPASVDFNALHEACIAGEKPEDAAAKAIVVETVYVREPDVPTDEGDGIDKLTKAELKALLDDRPVPVAYESDANKARLLELVRSNPLPPPSPPPASDTDQA
jgi:hypothetical protein